MLPGEEILILIADWLEFSSLKKLPRSFILPEQPTRYARSRKFNVKNMRLDIEIDFEQKSISGTVAHTIEPFGGALSVVELDSSELVIDSVTCNGKKILDYETGSDKISVPLGFDLLPGKKAEVVVAYHGTPAHGLYFRGPNSDFPDRKIHAFTQGQPESSKYWFPCYDYPNMRTASETIVTVPSSMVVVSNGKLATPPVEKNGKKTWHFVEEIPHSAYLLSIVAGDFEDVQEMHDGILLEYVYPKGKDEQAKRSFGNTGKMMDYFSKVTGVKYPYPKYSQSTVADFMFGGMENITATTLTDRTLHDARAHLDFTSDMLVAHELAHQWFGDLLTCKDWSHAWLNEGFATYLAALWVEKDRGVDEFQYYMYIPTFDNLSQELGRYHRGIVSKRYWDPDELFDRHTYEKGGWVLHGLRGLLGDEVFFNGIRSYTDRFRNSLVETSDFRKSMELVSGLDFESFFQQWLYSPGFPEYSVTFAWNPEQKLAELQVEQTNAGTDETPLFTNPIEVRFSFKDKQVSKRIALNEKKCSFFFSFEAEPLNVNYDPRNWVLKQLKFSKPKNMHLYQLKNDDNAMERVRAAIELASFPTDDVISALSESIDMDKSWTVQLESAKALGKIGTPKALEALLERVNHSDHRTRRGVAFGLRGFARLDNRDKSRAIDALIRILEGDEAYYARGYAAWSLGFYKDSEESFEALKKALAQESVNDIVRYRVFLGFSEMGDKRAIPLAIDCLEHGKWYQGRGAAAYCLGKIGKGSPEVISALLNSEWITEVYVKNEAAGAFSNIEDASVIPQLEGWLSREFIGGTKRRLRESIHLLRDSASRDERIVELRSEIQKLKEESKKRDAKVAAFEEKSSE